MDIRKFKRLAIAAIVGLGVAASSLSSPTALPAAAGPIAPHPAGQTLTARATPTPQAAQLNLSWYCNHPSPAHNSQFCNTYKNNQPHPDYR